MGQKILYIDALLIADIFQDGNEIHATVTNGLPADAELVRMIPDHSVNHQALPPRIGLVYSSASWPEQEKGSIIEVLPPPILTRVNWSLRGLPFTTDNRLEPWKDAEKTANEVKP